MSSLLELLGKGLGSSAMNLILPRCKPLREEDVGDLQAAVEREPGHTANKLRLAIHKAQCGKEEIAEELFKDILSLEPYHADAQLGWAAMRVTMGELEKAREQLQNVSGKQADDSRVLYILGNICERNGQLAGALQYYEQAAVSRPYLRQATERQAAIYLVQNDYDKALEMYQKLQKEYPEDATVYQFMGLMNLQKKHYREAIALFERALTIEPDNFELHDDQVEGLAKVGRYSEAAERMMEIIDEQGEFPDSFVRLGDMHSKMGNDEATVRSYEKALELHPSYLEAAVKLGTQHLRMKRFYEAATNFNRAIEINDQLIAAYVGLGISQMGNKQEEAAADTLELASALEPNSNLLFAEMVRLQLKIALMQKKWSNLQLDTDPNQQVTQELDELMDIQIERHRQALKENPHRADLYYRYGMLLRGQGNTEGAIRNYQKAVEINPSYFKARIKLGLSLREVGEKQKGLEELHAALELKPEYAELHYKLGVMYCDKMQFALAVEQLELMLPEHEENGDIHSNLALALQNMGLIDRAVANWRAVCELEPESAMAFWAQRSLPVLNTTL